MNHVITGYEPTAPGEIARSGFLVAAGSSRHNWLEFLLTLSIHESGVLTHGEIHAKFATLEPARRERPARRRLRSGSAVHEWTSARSITSRSPARASPRSASGSTSSPSRTRRFRTSPDSLTSAPSPGEVLARWPGRPPAGSVSHRQGESPGWGDDSTPRAESAGRDARDADARLATEDPRDLRVRGCQRHRRRLRRGGHRADRPASQRARGPEPQRARLRGTRYHLQRVGAGRARLPAGRDPGHVRPRRAGAAPSERRREPGPRPRLAHRRRRRRIELRSPGPPRCGSVVRSSSTCRSSRRAPSPSRWRSVPTATSRPPSRCVA